MIDPTAPPTDRAVCPKCNGTGYVVDMARNTARPCDCGLVERVQLAGRWRNARIPPRFVNKDFENFEVNPAERLGLRADPANVEARKAVREAAIRYARFFTREANEGLILRGGTGAGKTHLAVAILKAVIRRGYTGHYANFSDLLGRIRESWSRGEGGGETEAEMMQLVEEVDLLVLDDVGAERLTDFVLERIYLIINRRYELGKPLILTTNCTDEELRTRVGERTASRLCEMCPTPFPPFPTGDYRRAAMR
jgi:DNA replication protein DnaC